MSTTFPTASTTRHSPRQMGGRRHRRLAARCLLAAVRVTWPSSDPSSAESSSGTTTADSNSSNERPDDGGELFDSSVVHDIEVTFDQAEYDAMIATFRSSGDKEWITATITIDGVTLKDVGLRLKGNSSLMGLRTNAGTGNRAGGPGGNVSADSPNTLPWLVRLDKNIDGQSYEGYTEFVIRSNNTTHGPQRSRGPRVDRPQRPGDAEGILHALQRQRWRRGAAAGHREPRRRMGRRELRQRRRALQGGERRRLQLPRRRPRGVRRDLRSGDRHRRRELQAPDRLSEVHQHSRRRDLRRAAARNTSTSRPSPSTSPARNSSRTKTTSTARATTRTSATTRRPGS